MLVKITHGDKATINTGNYENVNPMYSVSVEIEKEAVSEEEINLTLETIKGIVDKHLQDDINKIKIILPPSLRVEEIDGVKYLHVTSAITPETPNIPFIEEHAILGTCLDTLAKNFIDGKLDEEIVVPPTPNVKTTFDEIRSCFLNWIIENQNDVVFESHSVKGLNSVYRYLGELDAVGLYKGGPAVFDFKKTKNINDELREKYFMQMAAYAHFDNVSGATPLPEYLVIVSPFNKPIATNDIEGYFNKFLLQLGKVQERYKI